MGFYRLLLRLFPASFRAEYGGEMAAVFAERRRSENGALLWAGTIVDVVTNAIQVHADLLWQDLGWTFRLLRQSPGFTLTAVTVAALGIGANTAAFTLLDHVLLRPLPFRDPEQLVLLLQTQPAAGFPLMELSPPNYLDWKAQSKSFDSVSAYAGLSITMSGRGEPRRLSGANVGSDVFPMLGVSPVMGRGFTPEDEVNGTPDSILLSDHLWRTAFGADPGVLGRTVRLDDQPYTVIGVMPAGFTFPSSGADLWLPLRFAPFLPGDRANWYLYGIGRLKRGVTREQAGAELSVIAGQLERAYPKENTGVGARVIGMRDMIRPQSRAMILAVFGAAFCVLLIACTNLANLLLARAMVRRQEMAVRIAIGVGRERLLRQLLTENLVLSALGGLLGLALASVAMPTLTLLAPDVLGLNETIAIDPRVFVFAAVITMATGVAFGVGPAWRACSRVDLNALRERAGGGGRSDRLRSVLVLAEVAGTVTLLISAGLLVKALKRVQGVDPGFRTEGVLTLRTGLPMPKYLNEALRTQFYRRVLEQARALPGVTSAAYISFLPMRNKTGIWPVTLPGMTQEEESRSRASLRFVTPGFFSTMGIALKEGRDVREGDSWTAPFVAVVSESFARRYWPGRDAMGRKFTFAFFERTVVGVVADVAVRGLEQESEPQVYLSSQQVPNGGVPWFSPKDLVVRGGENALALVPALRRIIHEADPDQPVTDVRMLEEVVAEETGPRRTQLRVLGAFAGIAFLLAAVGIHGLLSFAVSARTREVGVRLALGASRGDILGMFLRQGIGLGVAGVVVAVPLSYFAARAMGALLFGVEPGDPFVYMSAAGLAIAMTLVGSLRPAVMAARVDPAVTIRAE